jgi:hypothetical protein
MVMKTAWNEKYNEASCGTDSSIITSCGLYMNMWYDTVWLLCYHLVVCYNENVWLLAIDSMANLVAEESVLSSHLLMFDLLRPLIENKRYVNYYCTSVDCVGWFRPEKRLQDHK